MADIIINGPEGQSTINNIPAWATEATQATMAKTMIGVGNKAEKIEAVLQLMLRGYEKLREANSKGDKDMAKWLDILAKNDKVELAEGKKATRELSEGLKELEKVQADGLAELGKLNSNTLDQNGSLDKILKDLSNSSNGMLSFASIGGKTLGGLGMAINIAAKALGAFGTVILVAANYVKNEFLDVFRFFNNSLSAGTGGIVGLTHAVDNVATSANLAGMSLEEFGDFAQQNSKILRTLSARGFADLYTKSLLATGGLLSIGMTADDAVESLMGELEYRRRFGMMVADGGRGLQDSLIQSARDLRKFANAVGMSEADLRSQSEIQENNVDQLRLVGKTLGASEQDIIDNSQYIARQLGSLSMQDMINPLFEAISKGSVGLSDEMTSLSIAFPGLMDIVNDAAHEFNMTGNLNKNLGMEIATLFDTMSDVDAMNLRSLVDAGVPAADAISNLQKQIGKFSANQLKKFQEDFDDSRLTMQNTFNRLGFIVNQGSASIGDFGKTALISALGFSKSIDDAGKVTYDFEEGILGMGDSILAVSGRIFGENNSLYETVGFFNDYIKAMFGGRDEGAGETQEEFEERLDDARKLFVGKINAFAEKLGDDLNKELIAGTLGSTITKMFQNLIDGVAIAIYEKTGIDMGVSGIYSRQIREGRMGIDQYRQYAGNVSSGDREVLSDQIFKDIIHQAGNEKKITKRMSGAVGGYMEGEGADIQRLMEGKGGSRYREGFEAFMTDLNRTTDGRFEQQFDKYFKTNASGIKQRDGLSENEQTEADKLLEILNQRYMQVADFNKSSLNELITLTKLAENNGLDVQYASSELLSKMGSRSGVYGVAEGQKLLTDIDKDLKDMPYEVQEAYTKFFSQSFKEHGITYANDGGFANSTQNNLNSQLYDEALGKLGFVNGVMSPQGPGMPFYHDGTKKTAQYGAGKNVRFADQDFAKFGGRYMESMKDNFLHYKEYNELVGMLNKLDNRYTLDDDSQDLIDQMRILVESNKSVSDELGRVTNAITNDNST